MESLMLDSNILLFSWILFTLTQLVFLSIVWINYKYVGKLNRTPSQFPKVSVLVPMRNEEGNVNNLVQLLTKQNYPNYEIIFLDDHSEDQTWLKLISQQWIHPQLLLFQSDPLPQGWLGKNFACHQLAQKARGEILLFMDADVIPDPEAISSSVAALEKDTLDFLSVFPEQIPQTSYQRKVLPLMDFFLYSFLPFPLISKTESPAFAAANGQWMVFTRKAYASIGGHEAVRNNVIEDMALARKIKSQGLKMNTYSGTDRIQCAMYPNDEEMKVGFGKNIFAASGYSGITLVLFLLLLIVLFISPYLWFIVFPLGIINIFIIMGIRALLSKRFHHSWKESVWLHPIALLNGIQLALHSIYLYKKGKATWKGRNLNSIQHSQL